MKRLLLIVAVAIAALVGGCSSDGSNNSPTVTASVVWDSSAVATQTPDYAFIRENLPVTAGNVVSSINDWRDANFTDPEGYEGLNDGGKYYDSLSAECKPKITRAAFREDFRNRVVPMIDSAQPERITVHFNPEKTIATARVEQVSGRVVLMDFVTANGGEDHACNADGTIAIRLE